MLLTNLISSNNFTTSIRLCNSTLYSLRTLLCLCSPEIGNYYCYSTQQHKGINIKNVKGKRTQYRQIRQNKRELLHLKKYYYSINPTIFNSIPGKYIKTSKAGLDKLYLINQNTAANFVKLIFDDLSKNMCFVAEANPGLGLLTNNLLQAGVPMLHLYESDNNFIQYLNDMCKKYSNRLDIKYFNLMRMSKLQYIDHISNKHYLQKLFTDVPHKSWESEPSMQIIGATTNIAFIKYLVYCVVFQCSFMLHGRTTFYIATLPSIWTELTSTDHVQRKKKGGANTILFQTLFDYKWFGSINRQSFVPWQKASKYSGDQNTLYVIKIEPKANIFKDQFSSGQLIAYWYFVKYHLRKRNSRIIPTLERWIPGCGLRLIAKDFNVFTQFLDLGPTQTVELFKEFSSWPEYETCSFIASMNEYITSIN